MICKIANKIDLWNCPLLKSNYAILYWGDKRIRTCCDLSDRKTRLWWSPWSWNGITFHFCMRIAYVNRFSSFLALTLTEKLISEYVFNSGNDCINCWFRWSLMLCPLKRSSQRTQLQCQSMQLCIFGHLIRLHQWTMLTMQSIPQNFWLKPRFGMHLVLGSLSS